MLSRIFLLVVILVAPVLMAQNDSGRVKYAEFSYVNDSLVLKGGIDANTFTFPNMGTELFTAYEENAISDTKSQKRPLHHWSVPIEVFADPKLDKDVAADFKKFVESFPKIKNLTISFAKDLKSANYYVTVSNDHITIDQPYLKEMYTGVTYRLLADGNYKFYGCLLKINPKQVTDIEMQKKKLRQHFFNSIGMFAMQDMDNPDSLFDSSYQLQDSLSETDSKLLQFHYLLFNENEVTRDVFRKLVKKYQTLPQAERIGPTVQITLQ